LKTGLSELSEEISLILALSDQATISDLRSIISKTLGYKYKTSDYLEFCIRRSCKQLKNKEILIEKKGEYLTYQLSEKGREYLKNIEAYRNIIDKISSFVSNKKEGDDFFNAN